MPFFAAAFAIQRYHFMASTYGGILLFHQLDLRQNIVKQKVFQHRLSWRL